MMYKVQIQFYIRNIIKRHRITDYLVNHAINIIFLFIIIADMIDLT